MIRLVKGKYHRGNTTGEIPRNLGYQLRIIIVKKAHFGLFGAI